MNRNPGTRKQNLLTGLRDGVHGFARYALIMESVAAFTKRMRHLEKLACPTPTDVTFSTPTSATSDRIRLTGRTLKTLSVFGPEAVIRSGRLLAGRHLIGSIVLSRTRKLFGKRCR